MTLNIFATTLAVIVAAGIFIIVLRQYGERVENEIQDFEDSDRF